MKNIILFLAVLTSVSASFASPSLEKKVLQLFMVSADGTAAEGVGGLLFFGYHFRKALSPEDVADIINKKKHDRVPAPFIAIDQEGGLVQRLGETQGFMPLPSHADVGRAGERGIAKNLSRFTNQELASVGINWNFGTVLDVNSNPDNPVIGKLERSFSPDPREVARYGTSFIQGSLKSGIIPTVKHFPGHGRTSTDSHTGLAVVDQNLSELMATELLPFQRAVSKFNNQLSIMMAHVTLPQILSENSKPATLSHEIVTGLLRQQMGFRGLIVTDDLAMGAIKKFYSTFEAARLAILAGNDVLILNGVKTEEQYSLAKELSLAAQEDQVLAERIEESYRRILSFKKKFSVSNKKAAVKQNKVSSLGHRNEAQALLSAWEKCQSLLSH